MNELATATNPTSRSFCSFRLGERLGGIEVAQVREVSPMLPVTRVPQAPQAVRGLVNLRSRIFLAIDLRPLLGLEPTECTQESRLIILRPQIAEDVGVLVERGGDIVRVMSDQIEPSATMPDAPGQSDAPLITGIAKLENELMMIVDATDLMNTLQKLFR